MVSTDTSWSQFNPHLPEFVEDPLPAYRWLRDEAPVFHVESEDIWILSRYDDIVAAVRDWQTFSQRESVGYSRVKDPRPVLTATDPPLHTTLRRHTSGMFTPRAVSVLRSRAVDLLDQLLDEAFEAGAGVNFAEAVANPYLSRLVGGLMGLPERDLPAIKDGATAASLAMAGDYSEPVMSQLAGFMSYFEEFVDRWDATADLPATAASGESQSADGAFTRCLFAPGPGGRSLDRAERVAYESLLATGGNETTAQLLSNLTLMIAGRPDTLEALRQRPELRPSAVEETLRFISPVTGLFRHTSRAVELHGVTMPADAKVLMMYGSGNHDERHYDDPDAFVLDRFPRGFADADHLAFTTGVHVCLGAHLARLLIEVFWDRMAARVSRVELTGAVRRSPNALVRVIDDLPVELVAA
jgi:cytochrome P450